MSVEALAQSGANRRASRRAGRHHRRAAETNGAQMRVAMYHGGVVKHAPSPEEIGAALKQSADVIWTDVVGDPSEVIQRLGELYNLPNAIREMTLDEAERSRLLESHGIFFIVVHGIGFDEQNQDAIVYKLDIIFGRGFLITLHRDPLEWIDRLWDTALKDTGDESLMGRGAARLLHSILDTLVDTYFPVLDVLDDQIDQLEDATVNDTSNTVQVRLFRMKRAVATLRRVISPQVELGNSLIARTGALIPTEVEVYFADVHDHMMRVFEMLDSYRDLLSGLLDVYLTTVSNRLNVVMKQLTIIATIFMPITFITGVFGMNFGHAPQVEHDPGYNFWIVVGGMAMLSAAQIWYFRRRGWM